MHKRALLLSALALVCLTRGALAQTWPAKPIRLVVPYPPGGLIDNMARLLAPRLAHELGQPRPRSPWINR